MSFLGLLIPEIGVVEKILRAAAVYAFLLLAFRLTGKRQIGQLFHNLPLNRFVFRHQIMEGKDLELFRISKDLPGQLPIPNLGFFPTLIRYPGRPDRKKSLRNLTFLQEPVHRR